MARNPNDMINRGDSRDYNRYHDLMRDDIWGSTNSHGPNSGNIYGVGSPGFAGRGPKGYKRSDKNIYEDVCQALENASAIDASDLSVEVNDGVVHLAGAVRSKYMRRLAEDLALNIRGVHDVMNKLEINENPRNTMRNPTTERQAPR